MGLPSLKEKLQEKLDQKEYSEADVLYILVEMAKYIERSADNKSHLCSDGDVPLKKNCSVIKFFRDWAAHTEKDRNSNAPKNILDALKDISRDVDSTEIEKKIFNPLLQEIDCFTVELDGKVWNVNERSFIERLRYILAEQPMTIEPQKKRVGYNNALVLEEFPFE